MGIVTRSYAPGGNEIIMLANTVINIHDLISQRHMLRKTLPAVSMARFEKFVFGSCLRCFFCFCVVVCVRLGSEFEITLGDVHGHSV